MSVTPGTGYRLRQKAGMYGELEKVLYRWFIHHNNSKEEMDGCVVTDYMLIENAKVFGEQMGGNWCSGGGGVSHGGEGENATPLQLADDNNSNGSSNDNSKEEVAVMDDDETTPTNVVLEETTATTNTNVAVVVMEEETSTTITTEESTTTTTEDNTTTTTTNQKKSNPEPKQQRSTEENQPYRIRGYDRLRQLKELKFSLEDEIYETKKTSRSSGEKEEEKRHAKRKTKRLKSQLHVVEYEYREIKKELGYESPVMHDDSDDDDDDD
eukprot:15367118-Ditylum_brightwellii.AAC.1